MQIQLDPGLLTAFLLALVRASAWVAVSPPFNTKLLPPLVKIGLAAGLAIAVAPGLAPTMSSTFQPVFLAGAVVSQVAIGLSLGFITQLLLSAVTAAGSLIDLFGGFTISQAYDPFLNAQTSIFGRTYQLVATTLLFAIDGHVLLARGFLSSFKAIGAGSIGSSELARLVTHDFGTFFIAALEIAGPLLASLFLAEVVLGLLTRAAPQMNVLALSFPFKILLTLTLAGFAIPLLPGAVSTLLHQSVEHGGKLVR